MHTTALRSEDFRIRVDGEDGTLQAVFPGFTEHDRLGIVIGTDFGGAGASTLILAAVTAFYDRLRAQGGEFFAYADYFAFHIGRPRGSLRKLDVFPAHKEVVVAQDPEEILRAINDRGVTRLLVEPGHDGPAELSPDARASARRRIRTALGYSSIGRVPAPDVVIHGSARTESYVEAMLATAEDEVARGTADRMRVVRTAMRHGDRPVEGFCRLPLERALRSLGAPA
jgi:hypothetical protein